MLKKGSLSFTPAQNINGTPRWHHDWVVSVRSSALALALRAVFFKFFLKLLFGLRGRKRDSSRTVIDGPFAVREVKHRKLYSTIRKICTKMSTLWHKTRDGARRAAWAGGFFFFFLFAGRKPCGRRAWHVYRMHNVTVAVAGTWTALAFFFFFSGVHGVARHPFHPHCFRRLVFFFFSYAQKSCKKTPHWPRCVFRTGAR